MAPVALYQLSTGGTTTEATVAPRRAPASANVRRVFVVLMPSLAGRLPVDVPEIGHGRTQLEMTAEALEARPMPQPLVDERLRHRPSFECFGGHLELRAPVPDFWDVHWETAGE